MLFEDDQKNGYMHGFTKNYVKVKAKYDPVMVNELKTVKLVELLADGEVEVAELERFCPLILFRLNLFTMFPTVSHFLNYLFGIDVPLPFNTFGVFVALAFVAGYWAFSKN